MKLFGFPVKKAIEMKDMIDKLDINMLSSFAYHLFSDGIFQTQAVKCFVKFS